SVRTSTTTSPPMPCALTTRPTTRSIGFSRRELLVGVHHVDADAAAADARDQGAQSGGRATAAADHLAQVIGVDVDLDRAPTAVGHHVDADVIGVVDDPADQMFDGVDDDSAHSVAAASAGADSAGASAVSASSAALAGA